MKCANCLNALELCTCPKEPHAPATRSTTKNLVIIQLILICTFLVFTLLNFQKALSSQDTPDFNDGVVYGQKALQIIMKQQRTGGSFQEVQELALSLYISENINNGGRDGRGK